MYQYQLNLLLYSCNYVFACARAGELRGSSDRGDKSNQPSASKQTSGMVMSFLSLWMLFRLTMSGTEKLAFFHGRPHLSCPPQALQTCHQITSQTDFLLPPWDICKSGCLECWCIVCQFSV